MFSMQKMLQRQPSTLLLDTDGATPHAYINSQLIRVLSVARKFAMQINRWNTRLWRGQDIDVGDER